jgi:hypothetical protein
MARLGWKMVTQPSHCQVDLPSRVDLAHEIFDLQDLTERYWRIITAQHVKIARLESELACVKTAKR